MKSIPPDPLQLKLARSAARAKVYDLIFRAAKVRAPRVILLAVVLLVAAEHGAVAAPAVGGALGDGGWVKLTLALEADYNVTITLATDMTGPFMAVGYSYFDEDGKSLGVFTVGSAEYSWLSLFATIPGVGDLAVAPAEVGGGPYTVEGTLLCEGCSPRVLVIYTYVAGDIRNTRWHLALEGAELLGWVTGTEAFAYTDDDFDGTEIFVDALGRPTRIVHEGSVAVPTSGRVIGSFWPGAAAGGGTSSMEGVTTSCPCFFHGDKRGPVELTLDKVGDGSAIAIFAEIPS